jgi:alanine racemase
LKIWVEIDEARLAGNFAALHRVLAEAEAAKAGLAEAGPQTALLAVVKANAYGHGLAAIAPMLARAGAEWLGVTDAQEGAAARQALHSAHIKQAVQPRILVMSGMLGLPEEAELIVRERLAAVVWEEGHLKLLAEAARQLGVAEPVPVHLEVDTGMARQGVPCGEPLQRMLEEIAASPELRLDGIFTHFASTEIAHAPQTQAQQRRFEQAMTQLAASGLRPAWVHVGNSSFLDNGAEPGTLAWVRALAAGVSARSMVRAGLALYGYLLPIESLSGRNTAGSGGNADVSGQDAGACAKGNALVRFQVRPVMAWKTRIIGLREVEAGATVGYNGIYVAERRMRLALLPAGYADGLRRELSASNTRPGGWVMVRGQRAAIVGRVSMNLTVVDVSAIAGVQEGDEALLLGDEVTAEDHAQLAGTIAYEIVCGVRVSV